MKLSGDLKMLREQLHELRDPKGGLTVSARVVDLVDLALSDCLDQARHLEASRVQRQVTLYDLKDPKIRMFPVIRRSNPVEIPMRTPEDDGAA